jgi:hypothetical protein
MKISRGKWRRVLPYVSPHRPHRPLPCLPLLLATCPIILLGIIALYYSEFIILDSFLNLSVTIVREEILAP